ncbi:MAG: DUF5693 family protein [Chloroherpetonaceae bacterium]|nr:DUF5693 family protein [Chthonomonadaceae bacterium]MDW8208165.1 DUF5693 family protein [Chloroherpetonaceae bacterium]
MIPGFRPARATDTASRFLAWVLMALIATATVAGLLAAALRFRVEMANRRVEIGVEWTAVVELAGVTGRPVQEILSVFKAQGVRALIIEEETLATLLRAGRIRVDATNTAEPSAQPARNAGPEEGAEQDPGPETREVTVVRVRRRSDYMRIQRALALRQMEGHPERSAEWRTLFLPDFSVAPPDPAAVATPVAYPSLERLGLGLPAEAVAVARASGLRIAGRIANFAGVRAATAERVLRDLQAQGATTVIFSGEEVLGYRGVEPAVAHLLRTPDESPQAGLQPTGLHYGAVEFGKQKGDTRLSTELVGGFVRVHAVLATEAALLDEAEIVDRFVRAARERNIRFLYVRLLPLAGEDPVARNAQFVGRIARGLQRGRALTAGGMGLGASRPFAETGVPVVIRAWIALGVAAGAVWLLNRICPLSTRSNWQVLLLLGAICMGSVLMPGNLGVRGVALLAGILFPAIACLTVWPGAEPGRVLRLSECVMRALSGFLLACAVTLIGVTHVVGLLSSRVFMTQTSQFLGIKAQHAVPLLIVALLAAVGGAARSSESAGQFLARAGRRLRTVAGEPVRAGLLLTGIVVLVAFALLLIRTGNDVGFGVSGLELKARAFLDRVLPVRPRTKEFLIGHPALLLGLLWWWRGRCYLAVPCMVAGSLGQVSLLNTFCHIHSPLIVSLWRGSLGVILGGLLGLLVFVAVETIWFRSQGHHGVNVDAAALKSSAGCVLDT